MPIMSKEYFNKDRKFCKLSKCFESDTILNWRVAKEEIFVYIELIEIVHVIVFGINRHWVIRIVKRSLYGVILSKKRCSSGKMLVSVEKNKLLKSEFIRKISECDCLENGKVFD